MPYSQNDLYNQQAVVMYLDVADPKNPLGERTRSLIAQTMRKLWPSFVEDCVALEIEGPVCGIISRRAHESDTDWNMHATVRLFDRYNIEFATFHAPMPNDEDRAWITASRHRKWDGEDFRVKYKVAQRVYLS